MNISELRPGDQIWRDAPHGSPCTSDGSGPLYVYRVVRVYKNTIDVRGPDGKIHRAYPIAFIGKFEPGMGR